MTQSVTSRIGSKLPGPVKRILRPLAIIFERALEGLTHAVAAVYLVATAVRHLPDIRRADAIALYPVGGFGHTIVGPDWLRRLHPGKHHLTFFGTTFDPGRHNALIGNLWGRNSFVWVRQGLTLQRYGSIYSSTWSILLFRLLKKFLAWFVPATPCYFSVEELFAATPRPQWLAADSPFETRYESRYYTLIEVQPAPSIHLQPAACKSVEQAINGKFGSHFPKRCALYLRHRGLHQMRDVSSLNRVVPDLDTHLPAIRILNSAGYRVLLTGDVAAPAELREVREGGLVDAPSAGVDRDTFRMFAGLEVDLHIGCLSGGSAFLYTADIPALMINAFAPGDGLPRTTVYYKWLVRQDGSPLSLNELLGGMFFDHQLHGCDLIENSTEEITEAVDDFIRNLASPRPYGINPADLGVDAPWLRAANARLSPVWLKHYNARRTTRLNGKAS